MHLKALIFYAFVLVGIGRAHTSNAQDYPLSSGWSFARGYLYNMNKTPPWEKVDLPHTWNAEDVQDGNTAYYRGLGVYKRKLDIPSGEKKRYFLHFEGSTLVTDVYVNGRHAGQHKGGYTGFTFEITDLVNPGNENELFVYVNNAWTSNVMPLVGDFNVYGGIHRPVHLLIREEACIDPLSYGSSGIFISQTEVSTEQAQLEVQGSISHTGNRTKEVMITSSILDAESTEVWTETKQIQLTPNSKSEWTHELTLNKPHLWQGILDPYLYTWETTIKEGDRTLDEQTQPLGLRSIRVDPDKGLFLNGTYTDVKGVCYHEAKAGKGSALTPADYQEDLQMILDMGANAIRTAHYPHSKYFYELCDSLGILVYTEIPMVGPGGYLGRGFMNTEDFKANGKEQLKELIRQNYNHPSIFCWGLYNEVKINGDDPHEYIQELHALAKEEDPYRYTMAATFQNNHNDHITDLVGWNKYYGWYGGDPKQMGTWADETHARFPDRPISVSEYGAGASIHHHSDSLIAPKASGTWHPEEWQAYYHEKNWEELKSRPFLWGKFIWLMFDFGAAHRSEGDRNGVNDKGLVTADRKTKKDAYYFYQANWNKEPMLELAEKRFTNRVRPTVQIKAYTNLEAVTFFLNGKKIAKVKQENGMALTPEVTLKEGENSIEVTGRSGKRQMSDQIIWNYVKI